MREVNAATRRILAPPPRLTISEWADKYRIISRPAAEPGQWRTDRAPYLRGLMDALSNPAIEEVVAMFASQVGKTEAINNAIGFYIDQDPTAILVVQPDLDRAQSWSVDRLTPMLRDTPRLAGKVRDARERDSGNTQLRKIFDGGNLTIVGARSPAGLASRAIRVVLCDEVDRYMASAGREGDPIELARQRTATFWNRKICLISTPTIKGKSRIDAAYQQSDQREYWVPCPHCGHMQVLTWGGIVWDKGAPETAHYVCAGCGDPIEEWEKGGMVAKGEWRARARSNVAGFWINALYSPWARWGALADEFIKAADNPELLQTFANLKLAEPWEEMGEQIESHVLYERLEDYGGPADEDGNKLAYVPDGAVVLTAAVDVQGDRLEASTWAWGPGEESWWIDTTMALGDPGTVEPWTEIDRYLARQIPSAYGVPFTIGMAFVDSGGHHTKQVYEFTRARALRHIYASKGMSAAGYPLLGKPSRNNSARAILYPVGPDTAKDAIASRLRIKIPGPGYVHLPETADREILEQLTAERKITRYAKGRPVRAWMLPSGRRNEQLDMFVYSLAALAAFGPITLRKMPEQLAKLRAEGEKRKAAADAAKPKDEQKPAEPKTRKRPNWVGRWRE